MSAKLKCESCGTSGARLFQRDTDGKFVCAPDVPDSTWKQWPKWRELKARTVQAFKTSQKRSALARKNFGKAVK